MAITGNPLQIPEILATVLQYADNKTLIAAAQVNSLWTEDATNNIWKGQGENFGGCMADPLLGLVDCCSDERLQWYTRKIHHLWIYIIEGNDRFQKLLEQGRFEFPNARSINIYVWDLEERHLARLLTPKIVALRLFSPFTSPILDEIKIRSPSLKLLLICWQNSFTNDEFLDFLVHMPSITHLDGDENREALTGTKLLHHIALRPNLESLRYVESTIFEPIALEHTPRLALRNLNVLVRREHEKFVLPALRKLKNLRSLSLDQMSECPPSMLEWLSICCPLLEEFTVWGWGESVQVTGEGIVRLARRCPSLRHLNMFIGDERDYTFTDERIEEITSTLPKLEFLRLSRKLPLLSIRSLMSFARNCPRLHVLDLPGIFELTSLLDQPPGVTFPLLQALAIDHTIPAISRHRAGVDVARLERSLERMLTVLGARFPSLRKFETSVGKNEYHYRIKDHLQDTRKANCAKASASTTVKEELVRVLFARI